MAIYYTARKGLTKPKGTIQDIMDNCMSKDVIFINQKTLDLQRPLELKGGITIQGDPDKPRAVINVKERDVGMFVGATMQGDITLKHVDLMLGDSSVGFRSNSNNVNLIFDDAQIIHKKTTQTPYRGLIVDAGGQCKVTFIDSIVDSCAMNVQTVEMIRSNIGDWFMDDSSIVTKSISAKNSAFQNVLIDQAQFSFDSCLFGGNVRLDHTKATGSKLQLTCLPVLNFRGASGSIKEDSTSLIVGEGSIVDINGIRQDSRNEKRVTVDKGVVLPEWRALGVVGGTLRINDGILNNGTLKNVARSGEILFENVMDDSSWEVSQDVNLSNKNSKSQLFSSNLESNLTATTKPLTALEQLDELIGLEGIKERIKQIVAQAKMDAERKKRGVSNSDLKRTLNIVFAGSPGTGKTVVARLVGQALYEAGVLKSTNFIEARQADFVGEHVGETTAITRNLVQKAVDGVLFIDEAYELAPPRGGGNTYNNEAVTELIANMENYGDRLVVLMAGYSSDMIRFFKDGNEGLASRMNNWIEFPDYSPEEMVKILHLQLKQANVLFKSKDPVLAMNDGIAQLNRVAIRTRNPGNGRLVRNFVQKTTEIRDARLSELDISQLTDDDLLVVELEDVKRAVKAIENQMETMS